VKEARKVDEDESVRDEGDDEQNNVVVGAQLALSRSGGADEQNDEIWLVEDLFIGIEPRILI
jgi:hypothetical protein